MRLVLMRHGRAGDAPVDEERSLTDGGREGVVKVAKRLAAMGFTGSAIFTSPLRRAFETAGLVCQETASGAVVAEQRLASGATLDHLIKVVEAKGRSPQVILVGHMPDLGVLAGWLSWGTRTRVIEMPVGSAVIFTVDELRPAPNAVMEAMITPQDAA